MKKMNRRDYLKGMGAAAGVIAGTELNVLAQHPENAHASTPAPQAEPTLLSTADVTLVFHGLMAIWQNQAGQWVVGFHSKKSGNHEHQLMVRAYKKTGSSPCTELGNPKVEIVLPGQKLELEVIQPRILDGVYFFQPPPSGTTKHDNDFGWVINLEGEDWYGKTLDRNPVHDPVLVVPNGLFYTLMKTQSTFRRQEADGEGAIFIDNVANYVGTNIYLKPGGTVNVKLPQQTIPLAQATGVRHEVHFMNTCFKLGTHDECGFKSYHPNKVERSDFYMHSDGIKIPAGKKELELVLARGVKGVRPGICGEGSANDESPCSAVGFGGPNGFPVFP
jgi:hypothetical protein